MDNSSNGKKIKVRLRRSKGRSIKRESLLPKLGQAFNIKTHIVRAIIKSPLPGEVCANYEDSADPKKYIMIKHNASIKGALPRIPKKVPMPIVVPPKKKEDK